MAFVISQTFDCAAYYLGTLVLNLHKGIGRTQKDLFVIASKDRRLLRW